MVQELEFARIHNLQQLFRAALAENDEAEIIRNALKIAKLMMDFTEEDYIQYSKWITQSRVHEDQHDRWLAQTLANQAYMEEHGC